MYVAKTFENPRKYKTLKRESIMYGRFEPSASVYSALADQSIDRQDLGDFDSPSAFNSPQANGANKKIDPQLKKLQVAAMFDYKALLAVKNAKLTMSKEDSQKR